MLFRLLTLCFLLFPSMFIHAQDLNIDGLIIKVSADQPAYISFPDEVLSSTVGCGAANYKVSQSGSRVTIKVNTDHPVSPCNLILEEGNTDSKRTHRFRLVFVQGKNAISQDDAYTNLSSLSRIQKVIDEAGAAKGTSGERAAGGQSQGMATTEQATAQQANMTSGEPPIAIGETESVEVAGLVINKKDFATQINYRLKQLAQVIAVLSDKSVDFNKALKQGMGLFNNDEERTVEVGGKAGAPTVYKIKKYFTRLNQLTYSKVEVTNSTIQFVSDLRLAPDGTYRGHVVFMQEFKGYKSERPVYVDKTEKTAEIILKVFDQVDNGVVKKKWLVFLGNITVKSNN